MRALPTGSTTRIRWAALGIALLLIAVVTPTLRAQTGSGADSSTVQKETTPTAANPTPDASADELRQRLSDLQDQLERERAALAERRETQKTAIEQKRRRRGELAQQLLDAEAKRQDLNEQAEALTETHQQLRTELEALDSARRRIRSAARAAAEKLAIHLRELPAREGWKQRADRLREQLATQRSTDNGGNGTSGGAADGDGDEDAAEQPSAGDDDADDLAAVGALAELLDEVHADSTRLSVRGTEVWAADGRKRRVELLSIGHVAFAYRTLDEPTQLAVTLASPADASGYRWSEDLPQRTERALRAAFDRAGQASADAVAAAPMDVTGQLRADALRSERTLRQTLRSGGPVMLPLAAIIAIALVLILERVWQLYGRNGAGDRLAASVVTDARAGRFDEAAQRCRRGRSAQARVLAACLASRSAGQHAMEDAIQEQLMHESPRLERFLGGLAVLAAIAPLLGLLGTVTGIIETFGVIRAFGNTSPSLMAGGISEALVTTATGLSIAIPILLIHSVLRGRARRITAEAEKHAATLLNALAHRRSGTAEQEAPA